MINTNKKTHEASGASEMQRRERHFIKSSYFKATIIILLFFILGFLIYSNTFESPFVFDDRLRLLENPDIRIDKLTITNFWKAAFGKVSSRSRPIGNISFGLNYYFHQYEPAGYHLVNIIVHIVSGILLWLFLKKTLGLKSVRPGFKHGEWIALAAALVWLVNPVQTASVTYIVQRLTSMAAMFFMLSFLFYLKGRITEKPGWKWGWFLGAVLAWFLALGCKQNTATLPFLIFLYEWYFFQDLSVVWLKRNLKYFLAILAVFIIVSLIFLGSDPVHRLASIADYAKNNFTISERLMTQFRVVIYYLSLIIFPNPSRLNLDYDFPLSYSLINPITTLLSLICIFGLIMLAAFLAKKQRLISFCIFWFLGNLVIESSVIPLAIIFEHRVYLPSMLVWLVPVVLFYRYLKPQWLTVSLCCALVTLFSYWTFERNEVWRDDVALWADCVKKSSNKGRTHLNLGEALMNQKRYDDALPHLLEAIDLDPKLKESYLNLGMLYEKQGKSNAAIEQYQKAIEMDPKYTKAYNNLGASLTKLAKTDEAISTLQKALQLDPEFSEAHMNMGVALAAQNKDDTAIEQFKKALQIDPDYAEAHNDLGGELLRLGKINEALEHITRALNINPDLAAAHNNLGIILMQQGNLQTAIAHFENALRLDPEFKLADNNLQRALAIRNSMDAKMDDFQKELKANPDDPELHFKMGNLYLRKGLMSKAIGEFEKALILRPEYLEAQNNLAMAYTADRQYNRALAAFKKLIDLDPDNPSIAYNIAVVYALQENITDAIMWLKKAVDQGYQNWELIKSDKDLANIRHSEDYKQLIKGH